MLKKIYPIWYFDQNVMVGHVMSMKEDRIPKLAYEYRNLLLARRRK